MASFKLWCVWALLSRVTVSLCYIGVLLCGRNWSKADRYRDISVDYPDMVIKDRRNQRESPGVHSGPGSGYAGMNFHFFGSPRFICVLVACPLSSFLQRGASSPGTRIYRLPPNATEYCNE